MICYRLAAFDTPLRTVAASQPARFNAGDEPDPTQYLSLHPLGPLAELMRNHDLRAPEQVRAVRTRTWAVDVDLGGLRELTFDGAARHGLAAEQLVSDDRTPCQALARRLRTRLPGLIVPSSALPGTRNVVLFGARVAAPYLAEPVSVLDLPASVTAQDARPLVSLVERVRYKREPHAALAAWAAGEAFDFDEPDWSLAAEAA